MDRAMSKNALSALHWRIDRLFAIMDKTTNIATLAAPGTKLLPQSSYFEFMIMS